MVTIFKRVIKMGDKDVRLWLLNYLQKKEMQCNGYYTLKKIRRH